MSLDYFLDMLIQRSIPRTITQATIRTKIIMILV